MLEKRRILNIIVLLLLSHAVFAKEIVEGLEYRPKRNMSFLFVPVVLPDLFSAKFAFEYKIHKKMNIIIPLEGKWMDYGWAISGTADLLRKFGAKIPEDVPGRWYAEDQKVKPAWNFQYSHWKITSGFGLKIFPFGEAMHTGFFIKNAFLFGYESFDAYTAEGEKGSVVFSHSLSLGYNWVLGNRFICGLELGEEFSAHSNPIENLPRPYFGFAPLLQFYLGFNN